MWTDYVSLGGTAAAIVAAYVGWGTWTGGRERDRRRAAELDAARDDERDEKRWLRLDSDLTRVTEQLKGAHQALDNERAERQTAVQALWFTLNQYIQRESLWFTIYHDQTKQIIDLNGTPVPLPVSLRKLPDLPNYRPPDEEV